MDVKDRVFQEPPVWFEAHRARLLAAVPFVIVHLASATIAVIALKDAWRFRLMMQILTDRSLLFKAFRIPWFVVLIGLAGVAIVAAVEIYRILRRWKNGQPEADVALRWRALLVAGVGCLMVNAFYWSSPAAFSGPFRVRFPTIALITAAFCYGAYAVWFLLLPRIRRTVPSRVRRGLDLFSVNAAVVLVLAEISLRVLTMFWTSPLLATDDSSADQRRNSERRPPGTLVFGFPINKGGHYDSEFAPPSPTRGKVVVDIGDSFSYGVVPHYYHFTTVAERQLHGVEFYNMGYPGTGPGDYLYVLQHDASPLKPDLVVVQLFVGNDVTDYREVFGPARWYDADNYLSALLWYRLQIMRRANRVDLTTAIGVPDTTQSSLPVHYPWLTDPLKEPASMSREVFLGLELRNALAIGTTKKGVYEKFVMQLAAIESAAGDVPLAFVLIPDEFQVEDSLWEEVVRRSNQPLQRDRPQQVVMQWLTAHGRAVLDLLPVFRAVPPLPDGRRHLFHLQDTHFNARGNEVAGRALAHFVDSLLAVDPAVRGLNAPATPAPVPIAIPFHLDIGDSTARRWLGTGWSDDETSGGKTFAWSNGNQSTLAVALPTGSDIRMDFEALPFQFPNSPEQRIAVILNGSLIKEIPLSPGVQKYSVVLPAANLSRKGTSLAFRYAYAREPRQVLRDNPDVRPLAVAWFSIDFTPSR